MYSPTYLELKTNLQQELDIEDETFITSNELLNYFNEAIDMVESTIHTIYEDYFLDSQTMSLVSGTSLYDLPATIYAQKIRNITYNDNSTRYFEIRRIKQLKNIPLYTLQTTQPYVYQYIILNSASTGLKIKLYPTPLETNSNVTIYFLRNAKKFASDTDVCDIPEFTSVIVQYARWKCMSKEGHPDTDMNAQVLQAMKQEMVDTLTARVPDEDNQVIMDESFYRDFDDYIVGGNY
jgi:hypothetical protein